jgi:hypothetical protein
MQIPTDAEIAPEKLSNYLLLPRPVNDKSRFLLRAGFTRSTPAMLEAAIRQLAEEAPARENRSNLYGTFWRVTGMLRGPVANVKVIAIWLEWRSDQSFHFITLKPFRE